MKFDFSLILTSVTALAGVIWLFDRLFFAKRRALLQGDGEDIPEPVVVDYSRSLFPVLLFVLVLRSFVAEPFRIPSSSMMPTLLIGDFILVNKFSYGLRLPVLNSKFIDVGAPERGDVVVFRYPGVSAQDPEKGTDYIKRVIGLPGDVVAVQDNRVTVNGVEVDYQTGEHYVGTGAGRNMTGARLYREDLPGRPHQILSFEEPRQRLNGQWTVPAGQYFVMGDNRDESLDSRYWGFVPEENLAGKAFLVWMNWDGGVDFSRIGDTIE